MDYYVNEEWIKFEIIFQFARKLNTPLQKAISAFISKIVIKLF